MASDGKQVHVFDDLTVTTLTQAGWFPGRSVPIDLRVAQLRDEGVEAQAAATAFLAEFGGLSVEHRGPGKHSRESLMEELVIIGLSRDHAVVLYDLIARLNLRDDLPFEDQSERRVLWDLEADLERQLAEVTAPDYKARLESARDRARDPDF